MLKAHRLIVIGLVAAWCGQPAWAENLLQVYHQAQESDPVLRAAAASRDAAQEAKPQARALLLPNAGVVIEQDKNFGIAGARQNLSSYDGHSYGVQLTQPLYNRGNQVRQRLADATVDQADVDFHSAQNNLILRVSTGYFGVLAALDNLTYATAAKNAFARQLEQANQRFQVGLATITDVYDAQARFDAAVSVEIEAINTLADAREALRQLTGQEYVQLNVLSERMPLALPRPSDAEEWVRMALENNLALRSASFGVDQARENIQLQKAGHYPKLDLNASRFNADNNGVGNVSSSQVSLQLNIPLYSGGAVSSQTREAAYNYEAARQTLENQQRDIVRTVRNAYRGQEAAISQIKALDQTRISTRSALEATQAGYEVGTRTIVDLLNAERDVYLAESNYAASRYSYIKSYLTLRQAAGQLSAADLTEINGWLGKSESTSGARVTSVERSTKADADKSKTNGKKPANTTKKSATKSSKAPRRHQKTNGKSTNPPTSAPTSSEGQG
ncbi:MAG: TolC family outer membrane protein [Candidatus Competibacteraceae bacterium]